MSQRKFAIFCWMVLVVGDSDGFDASHLVSNNMCVVHVISKNPCDICMSTSPPSTSAKYFELYPVLVNNNSLPSWNAKPV